MASFRNCYLRKDNLQMAERGSLGVLGGPFGGCSSCALGKKEKEAPEEEYPGPLNT